MSGRSDLLFYPTTLPPDVTVGVAGAVVGAMAGTPMVAVEGVEPPRFRATLHYRTNPHDTIAVLDDSFAREWQCELNEPGSASMVIGNESEQSTLVQPGDIVRFEDNGYAVFAWIVREIERVQIAKGEEHEQVTRFSGTGMLSWLTEALVYPANGLEMVPVEEDRYWSWQSNDYDDTWWQPAKLYPVVDGYQPGVNEWVEGMDPGSGMFAGITEWPWPGCPRITAPSGDYWLAPGGWCYFRRLMYLAPEDPTRMLRFDAAVDDESTFYFDGQEQYATSQWENSNADLVRFEVPVSTGWHVVAVGVHNSEDGPMWSEMFEQWINPFSLMMICHEFDDITGETGKFIFRTEDDGMWKVCEYPPHPPGWTPGAVIIRALFEAQISRFPGLAGVTVSFTKDVDSDGTPWPEVGDIATKVGTDYFTFLREMCETYIDMWMDPGTFTLHAWVKGKRGVNRPDVSLYAVTDPNDPMSGNLAGLTFKRVD